LEGHRQSRRCRSCATRNSTIDSASARLSALARAHALTSSHGPAGAARAVGQTTLHSLIEAITAPHIDEGNARRFSIVGCNMEISGSVISSLALLLHEFATNSVKYGALSSTAGQIEVHCVDRAETVVITWSEHGGPPVVPPIGNEGSAMFYIVKAAVAHMPEGSSIFNTASVNADAPSPISWPTPPQKERFRISPEGWPSFWLRRAPLQCRRARAGLDTADSFNNADRDRNALRRTGSDEATRATVRGCVCYVRKRAIFQARLAVTGRQNWTPFVGPRVVEFKV
jgi:two-component sensor histidine kinase